MKPKTLIVSSAKTSWLNQICSSLMYLQNGQLAHGFSEFNLLHLMWREIPSVTIWLPQQYKQNLIFLLELSTSSFQFAVWVTSHSSSWYKKSHHIFTVKVPNVE